MGRAPCCEKVGLNRGRWTAEEDEKLMKYIQANGEGSWRSITKNAVDNIHVPKNDVHPISEQAARTDCSIN
ncbi:hypothetical protein RJ640_014730 [Escallonia rubra]|uniref:Uncharacterized protein n=1 Tax=Escallonia rubra TaxID=112253 RepID=A0AA88RSS8_9ASTE|nr:hypothetical protein RJ640_014730 [Escallonia rubra]